MAGVIQNASRQLMGQQSTNTSAGQNLTLRLFQNNVTPALTDTASIYIEANFTGYAAAALTAASWSWTSAEPSVGTYPQVTFTSSANQTLQNIYGYYLTRVDGSLYGSERFSSPPAPYAISVTGQTIQVTPTVSMT